MENTEKTLETNVIKPSMIIFENETEYRLISNESENTLDSKIKDVENYMNNTNGKGMSDVEKDNIYGQSQELWKDYVSVLRDTEYTFYLNRKQFTFLTDLLISKLEYDANTVFLAIDLTNMLGEWKDVDRAKNDEELRGYTSDATEITYIYHLIAKHKVKGLSSSTYLFAEILRRIGGISKVIKYYDTSAQNLSKEIQKWVASFEDGVTIEGSDYGKKKTEELA